MANFDLSDLPERVRECLEKAGLTSASSVLLLSDNVLRQQGNLTTEECALVRSYAAKFILEPGFLKVPDSFHNRRRLSVGCKRLDSFLRGGVPVRGITEIAGESGSGKTQLCLQLSLAVQYLISDGGLDGGAVFICTEDAFPSRRLKELIQSFPARFSGSRSRNYSDHIFIEHIGDVKNLKWCLSTLLPQLLVQQNIRLIVVDSIAGVFRAAYDPNDAVKRAKDLQIVGSQLHKLARKFNLAVVCTNQVSDVVCSEPKHKYVPTLGLAWANMVTTRLQMTRTPRTIVDPWLTGLEVAVRTLDVVFAPDLPKKSCSFVVTTSGVCGI